MNAESIKKLFAALVARFEEEKERLGDLDAILGDGDHGVSMASGFGKANDAIKDSDSEDVGMLFQTAGRALMSGIGGASGPLFAMVLLELGKATMGQREVTPNAFKESVKNAAAAVQRLGKAKQGDKTMLDVLFPVSEAIEASQNLDSTLALAAVRAKEAALKTAELAAKKGRAQYVQGAGLGHVDPGATSLSIFFETFEQAYKADV